MPPNSRIKLSARGGRSIGKRSFLLAAVSGRSLWHVVNRTPTFIRVKRISASQIAHFAALAATRIGFMTTRTFTE